MSENRELIQLTDLQKSYCNGLHMNCGMVTKLYFLYLVKSPTFDIVVFTNSVKALTKAHMMLRARIIDSEFIKIEGEVVPQIEILNCEHLDLFSDWEEIKDIAEEVFRQSFVGDEFPLFKFVIFKVAKGKKIVMLCYKGIIMDGWSYEILMHDLELIYNGNTVKNEEIFKEYISFLNRRNTLPEYIESKEYWLNIAKKFSGPPELPLLCSLESIKNANSYTIYRSISQKSIDKVRMIATEIGVTFFALLLTLFAKTISLYSRNRRFSLNLPCSVRPPEISNINRAIGLYSDFLIFEFEDDDCSLAEMAYRCQMKLLELHDYTSISSTEILKLIQKNIGESVQTPVAFTSTLGLLEEESSLFEKILVRPQTSQLWIEALLSQCDNNVMFSMTCIDKLISYDIAEGITNLFIESINGIVENGRNFLNQKCLVPCQRDLFLIDELNNTDVDEKLPCLPSLLRDSFIQYSDCLAIGCAHITLTYSELYERICALLYILRTTYGLESGRDRIGILLNKGYEQIVCAVAAVSGNFAYMPIDSELPINSVKECMDKAGIKLLITQESFVENLKSINFSQYVTFESIDLIKSVKDSKFAMTLPEDISVIINTSGTTGIPKSVCLYQRGIVNCLIHTRNIFNITQRDRVLAVTNFSHDMAIFDCLGMLICGGAVIVPNAELQKEPTHWNTLINNYKITIWNSVPAFMEMETISNTLERSFSNYLRLILIGGDWISPSLAQKIMDGFKNADLFSVGGPTETTIWNIYHQIKAGDIKQKIIPYGRPFPNTHYYILNDRLQLCPIGVVGTMYVSGKCLAAEYAGMPFETKRKFIYWNGERIYNTGDLGLYLSDATIQIKGRCDDQVKINGKRIEPLGIEHTINGFREDIHSIVLLNTHTHKLVAYYTAKEKIPEKELTDYMRNILPEYMIPSFISYIDEIPLARNGKVNRKYLAEKVPIVTKNVDLLDDSLGTRLLEVCKEILDDENITYDMNFYMMGGDSVSSLKLIAKIKEEFSIELAISDILEKPTIEGWAKIIRKKQEQNRNKLNKVQVAIKTICKQVLGEEYHTRMSLLDFNNIIENAKAISKELTRISKKTISKYDVICNPFAEDWIKWLT